jgi:hypothetical protein
LVGPSLHVGTRLQLQPDLHRRHCFNDEYERIEHDIIRYADVNPHGHHGHHFNRGHETTTSSTHRVPPVQQVAATTSQFSRELRRMRTRRRLRMGDEGRVTVRWTSTAGAEGGAS